MGHINGVIEFSVKFHKFFNIDLFHRGFYQIRCSLSPPFKKPSCKIETNVLRSTVPHLFAANVVDGQAVGQTFEVLFQHETVDLNDDVVFKCFIPLSPDKFLSKLEFLLSVELWYAEKQRLLQPLPADADSVFQCLHQQVLSLQFQLCKGLHSYRPVLFDYFHLCAVTLTVHASLLGFETRPQKPLFSKQKATSKLAIPQHQTCRQSESASADSVVSHNYLFCSNFPTPSSPSLWPKIRTSGSTGSLSTTATTSCDISNTSCTGATTSCRQHSGSQNCLLDAVFEQQQGKTGQQRLQAAVNFHSMCARVLLTSYEALQVKIVEYSRLLPPRFQIRIQYIDCAKKLDILQTNIKRQTHETDIFASIENDLSLLSGELSLLWSQFLELFSSSDEVKERLSLENHTLRIRRLGEGFFVSDAPVHCLISYSSVGLQHSLQARIAEAVRKSAYFSLLPALPVTMREDGVTETLPIIFEERFVPQNRGTAATSFMLSTAKRTSELKSFNDDIHVVQYSNGPKPVSPLLLQERTLIPGDNKISEKPGSSSDLSTELPDKDNNNIFQTTNSVEQQQRPLSSDNKVNLTKKKRRSLDAGIRKTSAKIFRKLTFRSMRSRKTYVCARQQEALTTGENCDITTANTSKGNSAKKETGRNLFESVARTRTLKCSLATTLALQHSPVSAAVTTSHSTVKQHVFVFDGSYRSGSLQFGSMPNLHRNSVDESNSANDASAECYSNGLSSPSFSGLSSPGPAASFLHELLEQIGLERSDSEPTLMPLMCHPSSTANVSSSCAKHAANERSSSVLNGYYSQQDAETLSESQANNDTKEENTTNANAVVKKRSLGSQHGELGQDVSPKLVAQFDECILSFVKSKEEFKDFLKDYGFAGHLASELSSFASTIPYFFTGSVTGSRIAEPSHLIICVHGLDGNSADLRMVKTYIELGLQDPHVEFLMSERNQDTFTDFETMTRNLIDEILLHLSMRLVQPSRISFVGHSLGTIIIRSALADPRLLPLAERFYTFLSLNGPHCGIVYGVSGMINMGIWLVQRWKKSLSMQQLSLKDNSDLRHCFIYELSMRPGLQYFKNVLLVGSHEDYYVPMHSALIQLSKAAFKDTSPLGAVYNDMVQNILRPVVFNNNTTVIRYSSFHAPCTSTTNQLIGRAAHIAVLDNEIFIEKLLSVSALKYFK